MSHFTVMVIGADVEKQLQPYHEFECTGTDDKYVQDVDITQEIVKDIGSNEHCATLMDTLAYHGLSTKIVHQRKEVKKKTEHKFGYVLMSGNELVQAVRRTNPNARWDWWQLGGRWTGFLKLKPNRTGAVGKPGIMTSEAPKGYADSALKGDVDVEGMRTEAEVNARGLYRRAHELMKGCPQPMSWDAVRAMQPDVEAARKFYNEQPAVKAMSKDKDFFWDKPERFFVERDAFIQEARDNALVSFAFVKDGQWTERGKMGWWASITDPKDEVAWAREFNAAFDALPDDTLISVVDCHI